MNAIMLRCVPIAFLALLTPVSAMCQTTAVSEAPTQEAWCEALRPSIQDAEWAQSWWMPRHEQKLIDAKQTERIDLLWIGDSITHGWEKAGEAVWKKYYGDRHGFNLGFSGDRTEHVLWRIGNGAIDGMQPKLVVMMIGTNNTGHRQDPAEETAAGVEAILDELGERLPEAKILLLAIFPRGEHADDPLRVLNDQINDKLKEFARRDRVEFLDISDAFLTDDGTLSKEIMPDLLHPNPKGYEIWAETIEPSISELLSSQD